MTKFITKIKHGGFYGKSMLLIGVLLTFPMLIPIFYPKEAGYLHAFLIPAAFSILAGIFHCLIVPPKKEDTLEWRSSLQRGSLPVLFIWFYAFLAGAMPFVIGGQKTFILALFETISGWTTVGLTVSYVETMPHIFLFYRSFMQFCGGIGFILMFAMFTQGKQSMTLYVAEGHIDRLLPSLKRTTRVIILVYLGSLILGTLLYRVFGMGWFDAVCHTMSAISTAGFSTQIDSIGAYGSAPIELITICFMLIGSTNFAVLFYVIQRKFSHFPVVSEIRFLAVILVIFVPLCAFSLVKGMGLDIGEAFLGASFGLVTAFSTTGYSTMDYTKWPPFAMGIMLILMLTGGGMGSTAGGIKLLRVYLLIRIAWENVRAKMLPIRYVRVATYHTVQGRVPIDDALIKDLTGFFACYILIFIVGALLITLTSGEGLFESMFEFASAFATVGVSNGITSAYASRGTLIVLMAGMVLGRLEMFIVFIGIYSGGKAISGWFFLKKKI